MFKKLKSFLHSKWYPLSTKIYFQDQYDITKEQLADFKELFALFDKDGDGILTFAEVTSAMKTAGQRVPGILKDPVTLLLLVMNTL